MVKMIRTWPERPSRGLANENSCDDGIMVGSLHRRETFGVEVGDLERRADGKRWNGEDVIDLLRVLRRARSGRRGETVRTEFWKRTDELNENGKSLRGDEGSRGQTWSNW